MMGSFVKLVMIHGSEWSLSCRDTVLWSTESVGMV